MGVTTIRPMSLDHLVEVVSLETAEQPAPWSEQIFRDELSAQNRCYLVAGAPIIGFGGVMVVGEEAHVTNLLVAPEHRRKGIARELLARLVDEALEMGARHLTLEVRESNVAARALYSSMGLAPVGVRRGYYGDEDALIMWAHDIAFRKRRDDLTQERTG